MTSQAQKTGSLADLEFLYPAPAEDTSKVRDRVNHVSTRIMPTMNSTLAGGFLSLSKRVYTCEAPGLETWALACGIDRKPHIIIDVPFTDGIDDDGGVATVAAHESMHWVFDDLNDEQRLLGEGATQRSKQNLILAEECMVNYVLLKLGFKLPTRGGKQVGIDPVATYKWVKDKCKEHSVSCPAQIKDFYKDTMTVFSILEELPVDRKGGNGGWCTHGQPGLMIPGEASPSGQPMDLPQDKDAISQIVQQGLEIAVHEALVNKNPQARAEIEALMDATESSEKAHNTWHDLGAFKLRGTVSKRKRADKQVAKWASKWVGTKLAEDATRQTYNRKIPWERMIGPKGKTRKKVVVIAGDVSGSVSQEKVDKLVALIGRDHPDAEFVNLMWDANCKRVDDGDAVTGGGGTDFRCVDNWINANMKLAKPDCLLVVTDGWFEKFTPTCLPAAKIGWIIIDGGDPWMETWTPRMTVICRDF